MNDKEVMFVVVGEAAQNAYKASRASLERYSNFPVNPVMPETGAGMTAKQVSRWAKLNLDKYARATSSLYLDADTLIHGDLSAGFDILESGFDLAICPSMQQGDDCLWHVSEDERSATFTELGYVPLQLQAGVFFVNWNKRTRKLWSAWRAEYLRYQDEDQGAFLRALDSAPVKMWLLGYPYNGGALVDHKCGALRRP